MSYYIYMTRQTRGVDLNYKYIGNMIFYSSKFKYSVSLLRAPFLLFFFFTPFWSFRLPFLFLCLTLRQVFKGNIRGVFLYQFYFATYGFDEFVGFIPYILSLLTILVLPFQTLDYFVDIGFEVGEYGFVVQNFLVALADLILESKNLSEIFWYQVMQIQFLIIFVLLQGLYSQILTPSAQFILDFLSFKVPQLSPVSNVFLKYFIVQVLG